MPVKMSIAQSIVKIHGEICKNDSLDVNWQMDDVTTVSEEVNSQFSN